MATYSDLVTLLLCFFVLLFAYSTIDAKKFSAIMQSFQGSLGVLEGGKTIEEDQYPHADKLPKDLTTVESQEFEDFKKIKALVEEYAIEKDLETKILAKIEERGLVIRILDDVFFDSGKAEIKDEFREVLFSLGEILGKEEFEDRIIKIEGHTDSDPLLSTNKYPSNWELSVIRATNVLRFLTENDFIDEKLISASGYAYYRPVAPNDSASNKSKNRRVDIVILKSSYGKWEPN